MSTQKGASYPDLAGQPVLVTGAGSGIGAAIAEALAGEYAVDARMPFLCSTTPRTEEG